MEALHMDETQPDMRLPDDGDDFALDQLPFDLTNRGLTARRQSSHNNATNQARSSGKDDQILGFLKQIMQDQRE